MVSAPNRGGVEHFERIVGGESVEFPVITTPRPMDSVRKRRSLDFDLYEFDKDPVPAKCSICIAGTNLIKYYIQKGKSRAEIIENLTEMCIGFKYRPPKICGELFNTIGPLMIDILSTVTMSAKDVCSFVFNVACGNGDVAGHRWQVQLPDVPKPNVPQRNPPKDTTPKLRVLHISDTHYDPLYEIGSKDICDLPMCCRRENGMAMKNESAAGKWGGWKCDIPERTLDNMLEHIVQTHPKFDYILWTGDIPPHASWSQTKEESLTLLKSTVNKIRKHFPDTPLFPTVGNHEPAPAHNFPPPNIGRQETIKWFYEALVEEWGQFLPNSTIDTIRKAGYYITQVQPKLKIISLNTNFCYYNNWVAHSKQY
ncbi:UNVERIFIED_CONTAM: hypothetical protein PYX00_009858 [Menopon gallinae]|uniref:Saposin B-type domain-containing protein n=1 Tax=Menopon gallinae TaxID=328185 RepID=A0AAW2HD70_9NEOP